MVVPKLNFANTMPDNSQNSYLNQPNPKRPLDTVINIQRGQILVKNSFNTPCSLSLLPMDSSPPSKINYTERVVTLNNRIDIKMANPSMDNTRYNLPEHMHGNNEAAPSASCQINSSTLPVMPLTIPYEANALVNPHLWDGHFSPVSLFGTNEFLQSNAWNISYSLICITEFIKQRNITDYNGNKILQIDSFGKAALTFIQAIYEAR